MMKTSYLGKCTTITSISMQYSIFKEGQIRVMKAFVREDIFTPLAIRDEFLNWLQKKNCTEREAHTHGCVCAHRGEGP